MKVYTYSKAREKLADILEESKTEEIVIRRRKGDLFVVSPKNTLQRSPFDVPGIKTAMTTKDVLRAVRESRARTIKTSRV